MSNYDRLCPVVPHPRAGTAGQGQQPGEGRRDGRDAISLKALARLGFERRSRVSGETAEITEDCPTAPAAAGQVVDEDVSTDFEERAAIVEYEGGAPKEWVEGFARLDIGKPIRGFSPDRWRQLLDDGGRFLDHWARRAAELGWTAEDVFGLNPAAPAARQASKGLVPLIGDGKVIDIKADRATIQMPSGSCLTYYLRRPNPDAVVVWELAAA